MLTTNLTANDRSLSSASPAPSPSGTSTPTTKTTLNKNIAVNNRRLGSVDSNNSSDHESLKRDRDSVDYDSESSAIKKLRTQERQQMMDEVGLDEDQVIYLD